MDSTTPESTILSSSLNNIPIIPTPINTSQGPKFTFRDF